MKIQIQRFKFLDKCTIGRLLIDGEKVCYTLEDRFREIDGRPVTDWKVFGETAIPKGSYRVVCDYSDHFKRVLPHILEVPGFSGVRIHSGNSEKDTEGCILVGHEWSGVDFIGHSHEAFDALYQRIKAASEVEISIE